MSVAYDRQHGLVAECDECGATSEGSTSGFERHEFRGFISSIRADGWKVAKEEGTWEHFCPECAHVTN